MTGRPPSPFFTLSWAVTAPALILLIWVFTLLDHSAPTFNAGAYHYPAWSLACGWALTSLSLAALPLAALQEVLAARREGSLIQVSNRVKMNLYTRRRIKKPKTSLVSSSLK
jgi:hypothetical protein